MPNKDDEADESTGPCKFRNHDHKFEWTRLQSSAGLLASR
jgi:small RNA 2'-O-methyltransferase